MAQFDIQAVFKISGLSELNAAFRQISSEANKVGRNFSRFSSDAGRFARNIGIAGAAAGTALAAAGARFSEFQDQFSEVVTLLDNSSFTSGNLEEGIAGLEAGIVSLRGETGETFANLNKGLFDFISATGDAESGIENLSIATNLAIAGATETSIAVDGLTSVMGAFGESAGTAEEIAQKFFVAQKDGKTDVEQLARSIGLVASQANAAGVDFNELLASVSSATVAGIRTNAAFTGLRGAIDNIQKPTKDAREEAERLGISFDATALRTNGLIGVLQSATQSANFTEESFVKLFGSVEARNFALAVARENFAGASSTLANLNDETLSATLFSNALAERQDTLGFATNRLIGLFDSLVVGIGKRLSPAIKILFQLLGDLITEFQPDILAFFQELNDRAVVFLNNIRNNFPEFVAGIRSTIASIAEGFKAFFEGLKIGIQAVAAVFTGFIAILDRIGQAFFGINGITLATILALFQFSGALRLIISAGILLTSVLSLIGTTIRVLLLPLITRLGVAKTALTVITFGWNAALLALAVTIKLFILALRSIPFVAIGLVIAAIVNQFFEWDEIVQKVADGFSKLKRAFEVVSAFILDKIGELGFEFDSLGDILITAFDEAVKFIARIFINLIAFFNADFALGVQNSFNKIWNEVKRIIAGVFEEIKGIFTGFISSIVNFFNILRGRASETKQQFTEIKNETDGLKKQAEELARIQPKSGSILDPNTTRRQLIVNGVPVVGQTQFGSISGFSKGGKVSGAGTGTSDSILAKLSNGEYVVRAAAVRKLGVGFLNSINNGVLPAIKGFADGGLVDAIQRSTSSLKAGGGIQPATVVPTSGFAPSGRPINLQVPGAGTFQVFAEENEAQRLQRQLRSTDMKRSTNKPAWVK